MRGASLDERRIAYTVVAYWQAGRIFQAMTIGLPVVGKLRQ
jgi:hypothetical protein